ncbi:MAG: MBL fold metallo-hydrolase [Candidatus Hodarchaeales archaeon]|jgi:ribonuclease BN (tRNA processing enzyme)
MMRVRFIGSGNAFNDGNRLSQGIVLELPSVNNPVPPNDPPSKVPPNESQSNEIADKPAILIDCGPGIPGVLRNIYSDLGVNDIDYVLLTHFHGDHTAGVPFFLLNSKYMSRRTTKLTIIGPSGTNNQINGLCKLCYPSALEELGFPIEFIELEPGPETWIKNETDFQITAIPVNHRPESLGYRIVVENRTIAITGDTSWTESLVELGKNADLFIMECNDFTNISPHLNYEEIVTNENRIGARRIVLNHLGATMLANLDKVDIETASDGHVIEL